MLDDSGYDCFFMGNGRLFRITGCWAPDLEFKGWSNVMCTRRGDELLQVFEGYRKWANALQSS
jgi:hypothetical protein